MPKHNHNHANGAHAGYRIKVTRNGPYVVSGGVPLSKQIIVSDANGDPLSWRAGEVLRVADTYSLCRCGQSQKWPFCDGSHHRVHFDGTETAAGESYLDQAGATETVARASRPPGMGSGTPVVVGKVSGRPSSTRAAR